jgi:hypothetical protein
MKGTLIALALLSAACSHRTQSASSEPTPDEQNVQTTVRVENQNFSDMDVFVLNSGTRVRLGQVNGLSTAVFTIPPDVVRISPQVRFELHPIGARRNPISETITIIPGDQVKLTIPANAT